MFCPCVTRYVLEGGRTWRGEGVDEDGESGAEEGRGRDEEREDGVGGRGERGRRGWWGREREGQRRMEGE